MYKVKNLRKTAILFDFKRQKLIDCERRVTLIMIIYIGFFYWFSNENILKLDVFFFIKKGGFLITWLPFSIILMYSIFVDSEIAPLFSTLSNMFASSSSIWSTFLYLISNKHIKAKLTFDLILCKNPIQNDYEIFNMNV